MHRGSSSDNISILWRLQYSVGKQNKQTNKWTIKISKCLIRACVGHLTLLRPSFLFWKNRDHKTLISRVVMMIKWDYADKTLKWSSLSISLLLTPCWDSAWGKKIKPFAPAVDNFLLKRVQSRSADWKNAIFALGHFPSSIQDDKTLWNGNLVMQLQSIINKMTKVMLLVLNALPHFILLFNDTFWCLKKMYSWIFITIVSLYESFK